MNGQLSNLDLMFAISRVNRFSGIPTILHNFSVPSYTHEEVTYYKNSARSLFRQVEHQVLGVVTGGHTFFPKYGTDSVTLSGIKSTQNTHTIVSGTLIIGYVL